MNSQTYQQCTKTVMDNIADPNITFDENGVCNYWYDYQKKAKEILCHNEVGKKLLSQKIEEIKAFGKNKKYDCIIGVSGGVDSTYIAYFVKQAKLRPLVVHFDNGWNSEIAVNNISKIIEYLGADLYTLVINWEEFKDLQLAYLKAGVIDIEVLTDHAIYGTLNKLAKKNNIKYVISGGNFETESILPKAWIFNKTDAINIKAIHNEFGLIPIKTYPFLTTLKKKYYNKVLNLEYFKPINYNPYNKEEIKKIITREIGWQDYGGKHYESIFTKFYQAYILPTKFKVDKRKAHLSNLICSNQLTREEALVELEKPLYPEKELAQDKDYVLKKFGLSAAAFEQIMNKPPVPHTAYNYDKGLVGNNVILRKIKHLLKK